MRLTHILFGRARANEYFTYYRSQEVNIIMRLVLVIYVLSVLAVAIDAEGGKPSSLSKIHNNS